MSDGSFLSRWSRRKVERQSSVLLDDATPALPRDAESPRALADDARTRDAMATPIAAAPHDAATKVARSIDGLSGGEEPAEQAPPQPTLADVALLTREDSYARFVAPGVDPTVRNAAMKKLFTDPHYNVMDGLDIYIDDYGKPDPIPLEMLRRMTQSKSLGLFDHEDEEQATDPAQSDALPATDPLQTMPAAETSSDEDPDLQLQPDDGARRASAGQSADDPAES